MRPSKRGRGVRARTLSLSLFVLGLVTAFTRNAAAADPLAVQKTAPLSDADRKTLLSERDRFDRESAALQAKGQYAEAMAAAEKMLAIERRVLGDMSADVAGSLDRIALCHVAREEFAAACKAFQEEVTILAKLHGEKDWHLANARTAPERRGRSLRGQLPKLGGKSCKPYEQTRRPTLLAAKGDFRRAIPLATKALETRRRIYGDQNVWTSQSLGTLATLYAAVGDYKHAEALGRQAIEIDRTVLGDDHVATAIALNNLAVLYRSMGDSRKAEPLFLQTLQVFKKVLGDKHPNTVQAQANLAMVYNSMGQYAKAEPLFRQCSRSLRTRVRIRKSACANPKRSGSSVRGDGSLRRGGTARSRRARDSQEGPRGKAPEHSGEPQQPRRALPFEGRFREGRTALPAGAGDRAASLRGESSEHRDDPPQPRWVVSVDGRIREGRTTDPTDARDPQESSG